MSCSPVANAPGPYGMRPESMQQPKLFQQDKPSKQVLCLGAHCDDIEIGCGGTILELLAANPDIEITWVVFSSNAQRKAEATAGAEAFTGDAARLDLRIFDFRDGFLPYSGTAVKEKFEELKKSIAMPDVIFTHYRHDLHQDHRAVCELTWNTFRNHLIFEYEIPKWDGDLGVPNTFFPVSEQRVSEKVQKLQQTYNSQQTKRWFTDDLFTSIMRIRGMECNSESRFAEGFYTRKLILSV